MQAKYSSTRDMRDMLGEDEDTTMSLHSRASTTTWQPEPRRAAFNFGGTLIDITHVGTSASFPVGLRMAEYEGFPLRCLLKKNWSKLRTPLSRWRPVALSLLPLCLVLLTGLAALGLVFFQFYQLANAQQAVIAQREGRLGNLSQELQSLQVENKKLAESLHRVAEKLCRELYNKTEGSQCSPCPEKWKWHGDKCYQFYRDSKSWQGCEYFCNAENSTMLKINTQEVLDFAMHQSYSEFFYSYWTGLSHSGGGKTWLWLDGTPYSFELFEIMIDSSVLRSRDCVTILNGKAFSKDCRELRRCACERLAGRVDPERLH